MPSTRQFPARTGFGRLTVKAFPGMPMPSGFADDARCWRSVGTATPLSTAAAPEGGAASPSRNPDPGSNAQSTTASAATDLDTPTPEVRPASRRESKQSSCPIAAAPSAARPVALATHEGTARAGDRSRHARDRGIRDDDLDPARRPSTRRDDEVALGLPDPVLATILPKPRTPVLRLVGNAKIRTKTTPT